MLRSIIGALMRLASKTKKANYSSYVPRRVRLELEQLGDRCVPSAAPWEPIGPGPLEYKEGTDWTFGNVGGRVNAMAFATETDWLGTQHVVAYIGTSGGVWRSDDIVNRPTDSTPACFVMRWEEREYLFEFRINLAVNYRISNLVGDRSKS